MDCYTSVHIFKGKVYVRGIENGQPVKYIDRYKPYLFLNTKKPSKYKSVFGQTVDRMDFDSIWEAKEFMKQYENVEGMPIYGMTNFMYPYIYDNFKGDIKYDREKISVVSLDIENKIGEEDIPTSLATTPNEITAITISRNGKKAVFGCKDFVPHKDNITYYKCRDEAHLLTKFIQVWNSPEFSPDVITGWNIEFYDIPYLIGRIIRVLGEEEANKLSPWGRLRPYEIEVKGKKVTSFEIIGITALDYLPIYKKFSFKVQERYSLDHIAQEELGIGKVDYSEYNGLNDLYERNPQLFFEYNIRDVEIVDMLDDKVKILDLIFTFAYDAKVNFLDVLGTVKIWDVIIHNYLLDQNIVVPPQKEYMGMVDYAGGYVKEPRTGMYEWPVGFDLTSLYPHLIMQYNISPETFVKMMNVPSVDEILAGAEIVIDDDDFSIAANGACFTKEKMGFLPVLMKKLFDDRKRYKDEMLAVKEEYEKTKNPALKNEIARLNNLQMTRKLQLNSAYGAIANKYFRFFDIKLAEAITISGQLSVRWAAQNINNFMNTTFKTNNKEYVIYIDTDSCYIEMAKFIENFLPNEEDPYVIEKFLNKVCRTKVAQVLDAGYQKLAVKMNAYEQKMNMKLEKISSRGIWVGKKKYVLKTYSNEGIVYSNPTMSMTGIEAIRSSTPQVCRKSITEALEVVMLGDESNLHSFIREFRDKWNEFTVEEIAFPRGVSDVNGYTTRDGSFRSGTPINSRAAIIYNKYLKDLGLTKYETIGNGDKIKYVYLKLPNPVKSNVIAFPSEMPKEFKLEGFIDRDLQFQKAFLDPLTIILNTIGWSSEKRSTLENFFF